MGSSLRRRPLFHGKAFPYSRRHKFLSRTVSIRIKGATPWRIHKAALHARGNDEKPFHSWEDMATCLAKSLLVAICEHSPEGSERMRVQRLEKPC